MSNILFNTEKAESVLISPGAKRELYHAGSLGLTVMYEDDKMLE